MLSSSSNDILLLNSLIASQHIVESFLHCWTSSTVIRCFIAAENSPKLIMTK